jgi:hypothetical protein
MTLSMVTRLLASDINPPHDTRHDTRLPVLTEVDGSMNPLEETRRHDKMTLGFGVKPVCIENDFESPLHTIRAHIYTLLSMTSNGFDT